MGDTVGISLPGRLAAGIDLSSLGRPALVRPEGARSGGSDGVADRGILRRMPFDHSPHTTAQPGADRQGGLPGGGGPAEIGVGSGAIQELPRWRARLAHGWVGFLLAAQVAVLTWAVLSAVAQRRHFAGTTVPHWLDQVPALAIAGVGLALGAKLRRMPQGIAWKGFAVSQLLLLAAACGWWGAFLPGSAWRLLPVVGAIGLALPALGGPLGAKNPATGAARSGFLLEWLRLTLVGGAAAGAVLGWPAVLAQLGAEKAHVLTMALLLVASGLDALAPPGRDRSATPHERGLPRMPNLTPWVLGVAVVSFWMAVPASVWGGSAGLSVATFAALSAATAVALGRRLLGSSLLLVAAVVAVSCLGYFRMLDLQPDGTAASLRCLAANGTAQAIYARDTQELQLWSEGRLVDGEGPDRRQSELTAVLLGAFLQPGDRVLLLGLGTGRLPPRLARAGQFVVDAVDFRRDARPLLARLAGEGPVPLPDARLSETHFDLGVAIVPAGPRAVLEGLADASRQALVISEPLHAGAAWQVTESTQWHLRRVAGEGLVVQPFALDRTPPEWLRQLFCAARGANAWNGVFVVGDCAVLVSAPCAPTFPAASTFAALPSTARWLAHAAHLGDFADLQRCCLGTVVDNVGEPGAADELPTEIGNSVLGNWGDRAAVLEILREMLAPVQAAPEAVGGSVLLRWMGQQARLREFERQVWAAGTDVGFAARLQQAAATFLPIGAPSASLQAALGLPDAEGVRLRNAELSSCCAMALDPMWFARPRPPVLAALPVPVDWTGALEDLAVLPRAERLVEWCSGEQPRAVALRARFAAPCAEALVAALAKGPLEPPAQRALREIADPFVLAEAGRVLVARSAVRELLGLWRGDLPLPEVLRDLRSGGLGDQKTLTAALAGRKDAGSLDLLADMLCAADLELRRTAGRSLLVTLGDRIPYDAEWPQSRLFTAAQQLRALHNRMP